MFLLHRNIIATDVIDQRYFSSNFSNGGHGRPQAIRLDHRSSKKLTKTDPHIGQYSHSLPKPIKPSEFSLSKSMTGEVADVGLLIIISR